MSIRERDLAKLGLIDRKNAGKKITVESSFMVDFTAQYLHQRMAAVLQLIEMSADYKLINTSINTANGRWYGHIFYRSTSGVLRHGI